MCQPSQPASNQEADSSLGRGWAGRASDTQSAFIPKCGFKCESVSRSPNTSITVNTSAPSLLSHTAVVSQAPGWKHPGPAVWSSGPWLHQHLPPSEGLRACMAPPLDPEWAPCSGVLPALPRCLHCHPALGRNHGPVSPAPEGCWTALHLATHLANSGEIPRVRATSPRREGTIVVRRDLACPRPCFPPSSPHPTPLVFCGVLAHSTWRERVLRARWISHMFLPLKAADSGRQPWRGCL